MRVWPTSTSVNHAPPDLYLQSRGIRAVNRRVISDLQGRLASESTPNARVRIRSADASGTHYEERVVADAQAGRGRFVTEANVK